MERYYGNEFSYIYTVLPEDNSINVCIERLSQQGIRFYYEDGYNKSSSIKIEKSFGVLLFITKQIIKKDSFRKVLTQAIRFNKQILCVYLEDVKLDAVLSMQTEAQQAMFINRYKDINSFYDDFKNAEIFNHMSLSPRQLSSQKKRSFMSIGALVLAALLLFVFVVKPLLIPNKSETLETLGLQGLSKAELESITELRIVGNEIVDSFSHAWYENGDRTILYWDKEIDGQMVRQDPIPVGTISDISDLKQLKNLEVLQIEGQQIKDISPLFELKNLESLTINCNPVTSLQGIEALENLTWLDICATDITDLSPIVNLKKLNGLQIDDTYIDNVDVLADMQDLDTLHLNGTYVTEIPDSVHIRNIYADGSRLASIPNFEGLSDVILEARVQSFSDFTNVSSADSYNVFCIDMSQRPSNSLINSLVGIPINDFIVSGLRIDSISELFVLDIHNNINIAASTISSLEGIEYFKDVEIVDLKYDINLRDLSPLNKMENLKLVTVSDELVWMIDQLDERIEVIIRND